MKVDPTIILNSKPLAEYLWYRFELQDGRALVPVLGPERQGDNRAALTDWVSRWIDCFARNGLSGVLWEIEHDLARCLVDSGLPGGDLHGLADPAGRVKTY